MTDPYEIRERLEHHVDLIIDGGFGDLKASTMIDLTGDEPELIREGCGDPAVPGQRVSQVEAPEAPAEQAERLGSCSWPWSMAKP
jgi:tRNA A37 threonylcarbamoyladenosine synthetase subunit TsaC/SUA5/YrdC